MKCPNCNATLLVTERQSVEIDYCPECRGVWLDRGELDKIIERSNLVATPQRAPQMGEREYEHDREHDYHHNGHGRYGKRRGWLSDLFD